VELDPHTWILADFRFGKLQYLSSDFLDTEAADPEGESARHVDMLYYIESVI
jgi:hypothetical protein